MGYNMLDLQLVYAMVALRVSFISRTVEPDAWYNKQLIISISKTKTMWNFIKTN
jgi:hypothetical protein